MTLTREQRNELLFLVIEKLQAGAAYPRLTLDDKPTSDQPERIQQVFEKVLLHSELECEETALMVSASA